jgi:hypothetical protein
MREELLKEYWRLMAKESPKTPRITQKLNELEAAIRKLSTSEMIKPAVKTKRKLARKV